MDDGKFTKEKIKKGAGEDGGGRKNVDVKKKKARVRGK